MHRFLFSSLILPSIVFGAVVQEPEPSPDETPQPPPPAVALATPPPAPPQRSTAPAAPKNNDSQMVQLDYSNSDVQDVLRFYEALTGKKLVLDNFVTGKVNIFVANKIPKDEAIRIIEINLLLNGYSLVPAGGDIVKVLGTGKSARSAGVPLISDESEIPPGDQVISYLFKLHYADPTEVLQGLGQYLSPPSGPNTSFLALPKAGAVLITDNSSVIRTLVRIINQVDIPPAEVVSEFIKLERADASKVVDLLKDIFEKGDKSGQPGQPGYANVRNVRTPPGAPQPAQNDNDVGTLAALSEESVIVGKIKIAADVRTNRIHVITRPINMPFVRKLIAEFDANVEFAKPVTRPLRYISAGDVLPVLVQALTEPGTTAGNEGAGGGASPPPGQPRRSPGTNGGQNGSSSTSSSSSSGSDSSSLNVSEELQTQAVDTTPKAVTVGNAKIIADQRANTIIVLGNREVVVKVQKILDELDVKAPQVALETVIGELTLNKDEEFGVDYFLKHKNSIVGTTSNTGVAVPVGTPSTTTTTNLGVTTTTTTGAAAVNGPAGIPNFGQIIQQVGSGTNVYLAAGNYLAAIVHALNSTGNFRVVSRPMVFTSNNKKAIIASGTEIPVPVSTLSSVVGTTGTATGTSVGQQSNIEFKKVALQLEVVPLINSESEVSLDILQKIDSLAGSQVIDGNSIPTIATRYIRTNVSAGNGSTILLGGLITDSKTKNKTGIPILGSIPYIGALFRDTSNISMRTELIVLMRPTVTLTKLDLYRLRQKSEDKTHFGPELEEGDCPDCPPHVGEDKQLPPPDLPAVKDVTKGGN